MNLGNAVSTREYGLSSEAGRTSTQTCVRLRVHVRRFILVAEGHVGHLLLIA